MILRLGRILGSMEYSSKISLRNILPVRGGCDGTFSICRQKLSMHIARHKWSKYFDISLTYCNHLFVLVSLFPKFLAYITPESASGRSDIVHDFVESTTHWTHWNVLRGNQSSHDGTSEGGAPARTIGYTTNSSGSTKRDNYDLETRDVGRSERGIHCIASVQVVTYAQRIMQTRCRLMWNLKQ